jgi:type I restriction enzyme R subunit
MRTEVASIFGFLAEHDEQLMRLGMLAERYFPEDPNTSRLAGRWVVTAVCRVTKG